MIYFLALCSSKISIFISFFSCLFLFPFFTIYIHLEYTIRWMYNMSKLLHSFPFFPHFYSVDLKHFYSDHFTSICDFNVFKNPQHFILVNRKLKMNKKYPLVLLLLLLLLLHRLLELHVHCYIHILFQLNCSFFSSLILATEIP